MANEFWIDKDPVRLYYGVYKNDDTVSRTGIVAPSHGWVTLFLRPPTGFDDIITIDIPAKWLMDHMDQRLGGNKQAIKERLLNKELYTRWTDGDEKYYENAVIRVANLVPSRYIVGHRKRAISNDQGRTNLR